jgi:hypothetical protein
VHPWEMVACDSEGEAHRRQEEGARGLEAEAVHRGLGVAVLPQGAVARDWAKKTHRRQRETQRRVWSMGVELRGWVGTAR